MTSLQPSSEPQGQAHDVIPGPSYELESLPNNPDVHDFEG